VTRLDDEREVQAPSIAASASAAPSSPSAISRARPVGRRKPGVAQRELRQHLVGAAYARVHARARVGDPQDLEQLLHGAVLAPAAVQRDERDVGAHSRRRTTRSGPTSIDHELDAEPPERVLDAGSRRERDLAFERATALEDGDSRHASRERRPSRAPRVGSGTTEAIDSPAVAGAGGAAAGRWPVSVS